MANVVLVCSLLITLLVYGISKMLYRRYKLVILSPLIVSPLVLVVLLLATQIPYDSYSAGTKGLTAMLQPATVAFAIPMYKYWNLLKKHAVEILSSVIFGSVTAFLSSIAAAYWLHLSPQLIGSLAPRSVTTPFAMNISKEIGGIDTMTAVFVIMTGISGMVIGPLLIRLLPIRTPLARGVMLGMGAHGAGTSKAFELGSVEGTIASLSMILAAGSSLLMAPFLFQFIESWLL